MSDTKVLIGEDEKKPKSKTVELAGLSRDDVLKEIGELSRERREIESRLKLLDRDVRGLSRRRFDREDESIGRTSVRDRQRPLNGGRYGERRGLVRQRPSSIIKDNGKRRKLHADDEDEDKTDDDSEEKNDGKKRKLYIRKETGGGGEDEDGEPAVSSAVTESSRSSNRRPSRQIKGDTVLQKRNRRLFGMLMGHLGKAKSNMERDRKSRMAKRKKSMEQKAEERMMEVRQEAREHAKRKAGKKREKDLKLREEIIKKQNKNHALLLQLRLADHEKQLANFIGTASEPRVYWLPAKHNKATEGLHENMQKKCEQRIKEGLIADLDEDEEEEIPEWRNFAERSRRGQHEGETKDDAGPDEAEASKTTNDAKPEDGKKSSEEVADDDNEKADEDIEKADQED